MRTPCLWVVALGMALVAGGCVIPFKGPGDVRREIESASGTDYDRSFAVTVGRTGLALVRWAVRKSGEEEIPIEGVRKVEIGVYEASDRTARRAPGDRISASDLPELRPLVELSGGDGESVLILSEERPDGSIRRLLIIVEEEAGLVLVRLTGRLDQFLEEAMAYALRQADRPDLVDPALEKYRTDQEAQSD